MKLRTPLTEDVVRRLNVGDRILLSGTIVTARDTAHKYLSEGGNVPFDLNVIYHCGPLVKEVKVVSAGPTTSMREEPYEADVIRKFRVRAVIGKGGMGDKTLKAMGKFGCVYLAAVGGAGVLMAGKVEGIRQSYKLKEFGAPEAFRVLEVKDMPLVVTMDTKGRSIYRDVESKSCKNLRKTIR
ncbi:MAG: FumA C-terminus/TtdB family hydratase beta subunit [Candidatus Altiarchaeota archaeon]